MASVYKRRKVGIGLLGSGVVGEAIQDIVFQDLKGGVGNDIELEIQKIYTRNPKTKKWFAKRPSLFTARAEEVIDDPAVEIVVEALGFQKASQLPAFRDYFLRAFKKGKSVVTSDKAVLARYGDEIWAAARASGRQLRFEACVGGGIPVMRALSESFAAEEPEAIFGIVNGTCNYILSQMERSGKPYADALKEAQHKGYAETNPSADVDGSDAEAKLLLLSRVAFGLQIQPGTIWRKGIRDIHAVDFRYAGRTGASTIKQPAVAVLGDVCELARGGALSTGAPSLVTLGSLKLQAEDEIDGSFYLRFIVKDRAGIVGDIGQTFGRIGINIAEIWQLRHGDEELRDLAQSYNLRVNPKNILPFVMTLEQATLKQVRKALDSL